jgi:tRNA(Ile)-lysidine synthase
LGLGAIPIERSGEGISYVRPLLEIWRADILGYLQRRRLTFREDPSNTDRRFLRNRIRHELLPLLERDYNPNVKQALVQLAQQSRSDYDYLEAAARRVWKRLVKPRAQGRVAIAIDAFRHQPKALQRQLVRHAIARVRGSAARLEFRHWLEVERVFLDQPVGTLVDLPGGVRFRREPTAVVCQRLDGDGQTQYTQGGMSRADLTTVDA